MAGRIVLAGLVLGLHAQKPYRPWLFGVEACIPRQSWANHSRPFPQAGYAYFSPGIFVGKAYYNKKGWLGGFFFFRGISWQVNSSAIWRDLLGRDTLAAQGKRPSLAPETMNTGLGVLFRWEKNRWELVCSISMHILGLTYPFREVSLSDGTVYRVRLGSNTFLAGEIGFFLSRKFFWAQEGFFVGLGPCMPFFAGHSAPYSLQHSYPDGSETTQQGSYLLRPTFWSVRLFMAFTP
ncbi:MAG: hypothetical protein KatS3mg025_0593 [Bacteroidia bacterium]|jgi:hypothetical protein|nr:MAG: hypothetical protein KatS3mg025_0593 [Bacteroidia bacterium]